MAPQSARRDRKTSQNHSASEHAWVMWIRFANSHTGQRHYARANRPDRWQHPTTANTRFYSCIFRGVHRWIGEGLLLDPWLVYSRQAFDHWAAIYGTSSALRDELREGGLYRHKVRQLGSDITQMLFGKGLNRLASGSVLWGQV